MVSFQSRNRDAFDFKHPTPYTPVQVQLFQSRNRDAFDFKFVVAHYKDEHDRVSIS